MHDFAEEQIANPHEWYESGYAPIPHYGYPDYPDGQLRSSAQDMAKFLSMFANDGSHENVQILQPETVAEMKNISIPEQNQGLIWYQFSLANIDYMGHGGSDWGVRTKMGYRISDGTGFLVFLNAQPSSVQPFKQIQKALINTADEEP